MVLVDYPRKRGTPAYSNAELRPFDPNVATWSGLQRERIDIVVFEGGDLVEFDQVDPATLGFHAGEGIGGEEGEGGAGEGGVANEVDAVEGDGRKETNSPGVGGGGGLAGIAGGGGSESGVGGEGSQYPVFKG